MNLQTCCFAIYTEELWLMYNWTCCTLYAVKSVVALRGENIGEAGQLVQQDNCFYYIYICVCAHLELEDTVVQRTLRVLGLVCLSVNLLYVYFYENSLVFQHA